MGPVTSFLRVEHEVAVYCGVVSCNSTFQQFLPAPSSSLERSIWLWKWSILQFVIHPERRDEFWLVPLNREWGEGSSVAKAGVSGAGSGAGATAGDATWLHAIHDPSIHDPRMPDPRDPGYWTQAGAIGNSPVDPTVFGGPVGSVPAAPYLGPVNFTSSSMETDINRWLGDPTTNFGWLVVGDERVVGDDVSSARGFASRENSSPPTLSFEYTIVPEPGSVTMLGVGLAVFFLCIPRFAKGHLVRTNSSHPAA